MGHVIKIRYSADNPDTVSDVVKLLESMLPFMLDNVNVYVVPEEA